MLVPVNYVLSYEKRGEARRRSFQDHTDKFILGKKNKQCGFKVVTGNNQQLRLSFRDAYYKDYIYFVFSQLLRNDRLSLVLLIVTLFKKKIKIAFPKE